MPIDDVLDSLPDNTLARRAQRGDAAAFDVLVARHAAALWRFIAHTYPESADCDDIVQETFIAAWKALPTFAFHSQFRTWLYALASRKTVDALRRRRPQNDLDSAAEAADLRPGPGQQAEHSAFMTALNRELARLPYQARAAWWLREVYDLSLSEIATVLNTTEGSVRGHLQRTRKRLATTLEEFKP
ncbi:ECF subfamily RNA polymerase sigma-24 factor [Mycolicibacterium canariasense]|uniref:ECF subfamily RNA polymerase sigma-24 factor n=1 Tax=Mycolicibacterium canariasense TaxID=228230 RepID=A0A100WHZ1_MYCCR|nr:sigma-70 family RNA polymerase sigma factor [Mycolicibacterium canariasense]MCV7212998.1 sigma-70 family RNA polymerase sigma factor [Mycolicibacterium canariasense]ORV10206.1 RNA polymerase subunit sigma [Mycolicibacterium canariasense]GAS98138.1 ECF subfamily RNA polymerase sigma-24 factor [Mycolicibacterium canariasense]